MKITKLSFVLLLSALLSACCIVCPPDVQQGNVVTSEQVSMLYVGMTKSQANYLLGTPVLSHVLNCDRWDYVYTCRKGRGCMTSSRLSLYFRGDRLISFRQY